MHARPRSSAEERFPPKEEARGSNPLGDTVYWRSRIMYYVYILKSEKDQNFYVGSTEDLKRRINEHEQGKVISTKHRRPLALLCYEAYFAKNIAQRRELFLKSSDGKKDLRRRLFASI